MAPFAPAGPAGPGGLDSAHTALARALAAGTAWDRASASELAAAAGLRLLDAALDRINEACLETCGEPLVEDDGSGELLEVVAHAAAIF